MQTIIAKQGQNFFDLVIQATGDLGNLFAMAVANDVSVTHTPIIGNSYIITGTIKKSITDLFGNGNEPATFYINNTTQVNPQFDYLFPQTFPFL